MTETKGRSALARIASVALLSLSVALVSSTALATAPRSAPLELAPPSLMLERTLASGEPSGFALELASLDQPASRFAPLVGVKLIEDLALESHQAVPSTLPETRVGVFEFLGTPLVGVQHGVTLEVRWPSARFSLGLTPGSREDPLGLQADEDTYVPFVSMPPTPELDALPKVTPPAPAQPTPSLWGRFNRWRKGLVPAAKQAIRDFWHTEAKQTELQREAGDESYKIGPQLAGATGEIQSEVAGVALEVGQAVVETEVGGRIVKAVVGAGGRVVRVLEDLGPASGPGKYVKRSETMSAEAKAYEEAVAKGRPGEAYQVPYSNPNPRGRQVVHFDGVSDTGIPIDAKVSVVTRSKTAAQAARQAAALRQHQTLGVWKVPSVNEAARARQMIQQAKAQDVLRVVVEKE